MDEKMTNNNDEIEIDLKRLFDALLKRSWLIAIVAVVCAVSGFISTLLFMSPQYQSSAMIYVNNSISRGEVTSSITTGDINASRGLVKSYIAILNTRETMEAVAEHARVNLSAAQIQQMITADAVDSTEIIQITVTSDSPEEARKIADAVASVLPQRISGIIEGTSAKVVASANLPKEPSSPNRGRLTLIGFLAGFVLAAAVIVVRELMDVTVRTEDDIVQNCSLPILAAVPDMELSKKKTARFAIGKTKAASQNQPDFPGKQNARIGGNLNFYAAEAYKLLRTKLQFSFAGEPNCRVISLCSALSGEGKSLTAINLAYTISELGMRVLLIDGDMRRPSIHERLPVAKAPGLSDYLTGQTSRDTLIQPCGLKDHELDFHVISAGRIPPNPIELLSSQRMHNMLQDLRECYDYILIDLPPVQEVSDALTTASLTDGTLLVVRQNYCDRLSLTDTIRQFGFVDAKVLGIVFNCVEETGKEYKKNYYYHSYQKDRGTLAAAARKAKRRSRLQ